MDSADPVVVGTDGSKAAGHAVEWAADEAARHDRPLRLVHAVDPGLYRAPGLLTRESPYDAAHELLDHARTIVQARRPEVEVGSEIVGARPSRALRGLAGRAFELVLGDRGWGGFPGMLLGSTGLRVAGHVPRPVVIVRDPSPRRHREVVVGVELSDARDASALEYAFDAASVRGARLRVLHAYRFPPGAVYAANLQERDAGVWWEVSGAAAPWRRRHPGVAVIEEVVHDHPVLALAVASRQADLVVVGARSRSGLGALRLGPVSHGVVHHACSPVVIVRSAG